MLCCSVDNNGKAIVKEFRSVETFNDHYINTAKTLLEKILAVIFWTQVFLVLAWSLTKYCNNIKVTLVCLKTHPWV